MNKEYWRAEQRLEAGVEELRSVKPSRELATRVRAGRQERPLRRMVMATAVVGGMLAVLWWPTEKRAVSAATALDMVAKAPALSIDFYRLAPGVKKWTSRSVVGPGGQALYTDKADYYHEGDLYYMIDWAGKFEVRDTRKFDYTSPKLEPGKILRSKVDHIEEGVEWNGRRATKYTARRPYHFQGREMFMEEVLFVDPKTSRPMYYEGWRENRTYGEAMAYNFPDPSEPVLTPRPHEGFAVLDHVAERRRVRSMKRDDLPTTSVGGKTYRLLGLYVDCFGNAAAAMDGPSPGLGDHPIEVGSMTGDKRVVIYGQGLGSKAKRASVSTGGSRYYLQAVFGTAKQSTPRLPDSSATTVKVPVWSEGGATVKVVGIAEFKDVKPVRVHHVISFLAGDHTDKLID